MAEARARIRALENAAKDAQRALEADIVRIDQEWNDDARRTFEAEHLAAIRSDARLLGVQLGEISVATEETIRALEGP